MKQEKRTLKQILLTTDIAFFVGLALLIVCLLLEQSGAWTLLGVLACVGIVSAFGGLLYAWACFRCPHCDGSLMPGGRIPMSVPAYCSHCGAKLSENE